MKRSAQKSNSSAKRDTAALPRVAVGSDHGGFQLKAKVIAWLKARGLEVADLGTHSEEPCDYPLIAEKVALAVSQGAFERGVLICKSGIGIAIAANKVPGIRAAVCHDTFDAERSRAHNDANVLVLGAEKLKPAAARRITQVWFDSAFEAGTRHEGRVKQIEAIEADVLKNAAVFIAQAAKRGRAA